jgi:glutathione-independent formaldehyde dehydrogenase
VRSDRGRAEPSFIVGHDLPLDEGPRAQEAFHRREQGYTKVALQPAA